MFISPSGGGQDTLINRLKEEFPHFIEKAVRHTTRTPRPGEIEGRDYYFVNENEFDRIFKNDEFLLTESSYAAHRGVTKYELEQKLKQNNIVILQLSSKFPVLEKMFGQRLQYIFLSPVAEHQRQNHNALSEELIFRFQQRGSSQYEHDEERIRQAPLILARIQFGDAVVYNLRNKQDEAYQQLKTVLGLQQLKSQPPLDVPPQRSAQPRRRNARARRPPEGKLPRRSRQQPQRVLVEAEENPAQQAFQEMLEQMKDLNWLKLPSSQKVSYLDELASRFKLEPLDLVVLSKPLDPRRRISGVKEDIDNLPQVKERAKQIRSYERRINRIWAMFRENLLADKRNSSYEWQKENKIFSDMVYRLIRSLGFNLFPVERRRYPDEESIKAEIKIREELWGEGANSLQVLREPGLFQDTALYFSSGEYGMLDLLHRCKISSKLLEDDDFLLLSLRRLVKEGVLVSANSLRDRKIKKMAEEFEARTGKKLILRIHGKREGFSGALREFTKNILISQDADEPIERQKQALEELEALARETPPGRLQEILEILMENDLFREPAGKWLALRASETLVTKSKPDVIKKELTSERLKELLKLPPEPPEVTEWYEKRNKSKTNEKRDKNPRAEELPIAPQEPPGTEDLSSPFRREKGIQEADEERGWDLEDEEGIDLCKQFEKNHQRKSKLNNSPEEDCRRILGWLAYADKLFRRFGLRGIRFLLTSDLNIILAFIKQYGIRAGPKILSRAPIARYNSNTKRIEFDPAKKKLSLPVYQAIKAHELSHKKQAKKNLSRKELSASIEEIQKFEIFFPPQTFKKQQAFALRFEKKVLKLLGPFAKTKPDIKKRQKALEKLRSLALNPEDSLLELLSLANTRLVFLESELRKKHKKFSLAAAPHPDMFLIQIISEGSFGLKVRLMPIDITITGAKARRKPEKRFQIKPDIQRGRKNLNIRQVIEMGLEIESPLTSREQAIKNYTDILFSGVPPELRRIENIEILPGRIIGLWYGRNPPQRLPQYLFYLKGKRIHSWLKKKTFFDSAVLGFWHLINHQVVSFVLIFALLNSLGLIKSCPPYLGLVFCSTIGAKRIRGRIQGLRKHERFTLPWWLPADKIHQFRQLSRQIEEDTAIWELLQKLERAPPLGEVVDLLLKANEQYAKNITLLLELAMACIQLQVFGEAEYWAWLALAEIDEISCPGAAKFNSGLLEYLKHAEVVAARIRFICHVLRKHTVRGTRNEALLNLCFPAAMTDEAIIRLLDAALEIKQNPQKLPKDIKRQNLNW